MFFGTQNLAVKKSIYKDLYNNAKTMSERPDGYRYHDTASYARVYKARKG